MKKLLAMLWLTVSFAYAQDQSTSNLITSGTAHTWSGVVTGAKPNDCCSGGPGALYDPATNTIHFSYMQSTVTQTFAINQALANAGTGIQVKGYSYSWDINNLNGDNRQGGTDTLTASVLTYNYNNTSIRRTDSWVYNTKFDWTTFSGDVLYTNPGLPSDFGNLTVKFTGADNGYWAGYYGPKVRNVSVKMNYGVDICASNPLSSPECPGYAAAFLTQQCAATQLYSPSCPGYAAAYLIQQCTVNALYDQTCPGYANAYLTYQCNSNPLYSTTCAGYEQAYFNQQCSANALYNTQCPGYEQAYLTQQCNANGLYSTSCPNYASAYAAKQALSKTTTSTITVSTTTVTPTISSDGTVTTSVSSTGDATIDAVITPPSTTSTTSVSATSVTSTVTQTTVAVATTTAAKEEKKDAPSTSVSSSSAANGSSSDTKQETKPTARQEIQAKREAQAKAKAVEDGKNLASNMGKVADMEAQKQIQNVVIQAMGFTPGFDAYGKVQVQDAQGYKPFTVYKNQTNVDNARLGRRMFGPSDRVHDDMVNMQWEMK